MKQHTLIKSSIAKPKQQRLIKVNNKTLSTSSRSITSQNKPKLLLPTPHFKDTMLNQHKSPINLFSLHQSACIHSKSAPLSSLPTVLLPYHQLRFKFHTSSHIPHQKLASRRFSTSPIKSDHHDDIPMDLEAQILSLEAELKTMALSEPNVDLISTPAKKTRVKKEKAEKEKAGLDEAKPKRTPKAKLKDLPIALSDVPPLDSNQTTQITPDVSASDDALGAEIKPKRKYKTKNSQTTLSLSLTTEEGLDNTEAAPQKKTRAKKMTISLQTTETTSLTIDPTSAIENQEETGDVKPQTSSSVSIDALQGARVKKNSAAANRSKWAEAAAVAAQDALDSAQHDHIETIPPPDTVVVNDFESAQRVLKILTSPDVRSRYHACDTETTGINPKIQSPVGHGTVICASIYCGPDVDFGGGARVWIDNYGKASGTLDFFKEYFEDAEIKKVWHNYSFDRHILYNHGINCIGFGGDTMHMARLWNSGRTAEGGNYGLESLTKDLVREIPGKESMTTRFGHKKVLKNGDEGKVTVVPGTLELQLGEDTRTEWIDYSVRDAQATWYLRERLQHELQQWPWTGNLTMFEFYKRYWLAFGEMLTDMERSGIFVRRTDYLPSLRLKADADRQECEDKFLQWACKVKPSCQYMNPSSEQQKQQLFFAPTDERDIHKSRLEMSREFETENTWGYIEPGKTKPKKSFKFSLTGLGFPVLARTPLGKPQINMQVLKELAGNPLAKVPKYGKVYDLLGGGDAGKEACEALYQLIKLAGIEITISTFIDPLTVMPDQKNRVHCSLNLNTETGRLSARKPNLQNQPSMDKDIYKIRDAFAAEPGKKLIVADYGQLELRALAHITKCKSMLEAFRLGGDFHSRTAMGMYKNIAEAVANGDVLLEWDYSKGDPPKPLLKDTYGNERKKAKILNFSIAYGKTARGLATDFGVSVEEAKATVDVWYADRPEVLAWQKRTIAEARRTGVTRTLMGRYRPVHGINEARPVIRGHAERMAINTPIQGGAADIVMAGMLKLHKNQELRDLGYHILLQIHDELIVEGPEEHEARALEIVRECMEHPFKDDLLVELIVDANIAKTWFEGK